MSGLLVHVSTEEGIASVYISPGPWPMLSSGGRYSETPWGS